MRVFESNEIACKDSSFKVYVDDGNNGGIIDVGVNLENFDGTENVKSFNFEIDSTQIDYLIEALREAKKNAEAELSKDSHHWK